jgi:hypothetical protein
MVDVLIVDAIKLPLLGLMPVEDNVDVVEVTEIDDAVLGGNVEPTTEVEPVDDTVLVDVRLEVSVDAEEELEVRVSVEDELNTACRAISRLAPPYWTAIFASVVILPNRRMKASINATLYDGQFGSPIVGVYYSNSTQTKTIREIQSIELNEKRV